MKEGEIKTLYQKTATGAIAWWKTWTEGPIVCSAWGQVGGKEQQKTYKAKPTNVGRSNERDAVAQALFESDALWKKKKRLKYYDTVEEAENNVNTKPMLAQPYEKRKDKIEFPVSVQRKLDGFRCFAFAGKDGTVQLMSRGGKAYDVAHVVADVTTLLESSGAPTNVILDGELYVHGESLQTIASLVKKPKPESSKLVYHIYDVTQSNEEQWEKRLGMLQHLERCKPTRLTSISVVNTVTAHNHENVQDYHDHYVADGYEGAIVRTMDHTYRFGYRSPGLLKVKTFEDKEFQIVGWTKGKDNVPLWVVKQEEGKQFTVRPKGTEEERAAMLTSADAQIGKWLTTRFIGRTDDNIPKFANGVIIRDKSEF